MKFKQAFDKFRYAVNDTSTETRNASETNYFQIFYLSKQVDLKITYPKLYITQISNREIKS